MAVQIRSDYPRGASRTRVSGLPASPGIPQMGGRDPETYLREMMRREDRALRRPRRAERVPVAAASRAMSGPMLPAGKAAHLQRAEDEASFNQSVNRSLAAQAARAPAPFKMTHGFGMTPGKMMDPNAMSAIQRQMFLPGSAGFAAPASAGLGSSMAALPENTRSSHAVNAARQAAASAGSTAGRRRAAGG